MNNILTQARKALVERLETISIANGYMTNIGTSVKTGWFNEILKDRAVPEGGLVVVQKAKALPPQPGPAALMMKPGFHVIAAIKAGFDGYEDAIESIEHDLLRCLCPSTGIQPEWLPAGATGLQVGAPEPIPPGDGLMAATVLIPIFIFAVVDRLDY